MNNPSLTTFLAAAQSLPISEERQAVLQPLVRYLKNTRESEQTVYLNCICTHNSRRSQFAQVWAAVAAHLHQMPAQVFSGGVEITACHPNTVASLQRSGLSITALDSTDNPRYAVQFDEDTPPLILFSKLYDDVANQAPSFAALMTCAHADENCPFIPGAEARIALNYNDPKQFDGSPQEAAGYDERSLQIASEMLFAFKMATQ